MYDRPCPRLWSHARLRPYAERSAKALEGDVRLLDEAGRLLVEVSGLRAQQVDRSVLPQAEGEDLRDWLYELVWEPKIRPGQELAHLPLDYMPPPQQIAERLEPQVARLSAQQGLEPYEALGPQVEILTTAYVLKALQQLGWELRTHQRVSAASLAEQLGVASQHRR